MSELVSVVITAYNVEKYIAEALESIQAQTYTNWELIISDDGSKDKTLSIIENYAQKDARIIVDTHENMGISKCANRALNLAKGKIIVRMDADDMMMPNRIQEQVEYLNTHPEVTMLSSNTIFINEKGEKMGIQHMPGFDTMEYSREIRKTYQLVACPHTAFTAYKDKIMEVGGYNENIKCVVDLDLFTRMIEKDNVLIIQRIPLMQYRMHTTSVMFNHMKDQVLQYTADLVVQNTIRRRNHQPEMSYDEYLVEFNKKPWHKKLNERIKFRAYTYYRQGGIFFFQKKWLAGIWYVGLALVMHPSRFITKLINHARLRITNK